MATLLIFLEIYHTRSAKTINFYVNCEWTFFWQIKIPGAFYLGVIFPFSYMVAPKYPPNFTKIFLAKIFWVWIWRPYLFILTFSIQKLLYLCHLIWFSVVWQNKIFLIFGIHGLRILSNSGSVDIFQVKTQ